MPQHDMNIANDTGAALRADANAALAALVGLSSGTSAPATTFAYMLWADTTTGFLKMRNAANSAWITLWDLTAGVLGLGGGILTGELRATLFRTLTANPNVGASSSAVLFTVGDAECWFVYATQGAEFFDTGAFVSLPQGAATPVVRELWKTNADLKFSVSGTSLQVDNGIASIRTVSWSATRVAS